MQETFANLSREIQVAWAAGLIEGEGCFTLHTGAPYFILDITDKDVLEKLIIIFPFLNLRGPYKHKNKPNNKDRWRVDAFGPKAVQLIDEILPFMCSRRTAKIKELLEIYRQK